MSLQITSCPEWEYKNIPGHEMPIKRRTKAALIAIRKSPPKKLVQISKDTRAFHKKYFYGLTPKGHAYYAGHYRGENFVCLLDYRVGVPGDSNVGHDPAAVPLEMAEFASQIANAAKILDQVQSVPNSIFSSSEKIVRTVKIVVALFVYVLEIHPYANGNGHMARLIMLALLAKHKIFPRRWSIDPRPPDPPYSDLIGLYRRGDTNSLVRFVLSSI